MSSSNCWFLTCIQIIQEAGQVVWYSYFLKNFPQFVVIHTVKGFGVVKIAEVDVFLELSCFFHDPTDVGNLISSSSAAGVAKSLQSCLTPCYLIDSSPPGSSVPGILQARIVDCIAISFSNAWKWKVKVKLLSRVQVFATSWTVAYQSPSMGFSSQEYWSGLPFPSPLWFLCLF